MDSISGHKEDNACASLQTYKTYTYIDENYEIIWYDMIFALMMGIEIENVKYIEEITWNG